MSRTSMARFLPIILAGIAPWTCPVCPAQTEPPSFRSLTNVVVVPTLVRTKSGEIVHGLSSNDFIVEDDGVEQSVQLDETLEKQRISIVVAVQRGRTALLELEKSRRYDPEEKAPPPNPSAGASLSGLGTMLDFFVSEADAEVAVVTFDSQVQLFQDFIDDIPTVTARLKNLAPGDNGAAILDALGYSLDLLEHRPKERRRIVILISEMRDHGSRIINKEELAQRMGAANAAVYSLAFSPGRAEVIRDLKGENPNPGAGDFLRPFEMALQGLGDNVASEIAELTGGEYAKFADKRSFDAGLNTLTNHDRNRYQLSFQPTNPTPGAHVIKVRLRDRNRNFVLTARNMYWAVASQ